MVAALAITALCGGCRRVPDRARVTAEILEVGTFEFGPGEPGAREVRFTSHGDVIIARLGSRFGFRFRLNNVPGDSIEMKTLVTHPPIQQPKGETRTRYAVLTTVPAKNGYATSVTGYSFDRPEEMTPGVWTFSHTYRGETLVKQSFTVRASGTSGRTETP
jgi:hypothetical protein